MVKWATLLECEVDMKEVAAPVLFWDFGARPGLILRTPGFLGRRSLGRKEQPRSRDLRTSEPLSFRTTISERRALKPQALEDQVMTYFSSLLGHEGTSPKVCASKPSGESLGAAVFRNLHVR